ncbi:MAG: DUF1592 domain-containing protein, partial [Roseimicrobium sp.]
MPTPSRSRIPIRTQAFAAAVAAAFVSLASSAFPLSAAPNVTGFVDQHCAECHDAEMKKGGLDLTALKWDPAKRENFDEWVKVFDRVTTGEMPPAKKPRPEGAALTPFLASLKGELHNANAGQQKVTGRTLLRRLNRVEYERTVQDLLGIQTSLKDILPADTPMHGFDTVAEGLRLSTLQIEKYLEAADTAIEAAINLQVAPEPLAKKQYFFKEDQGTRKHLDIAEGTITNKNDPKSAHKHLLKELPDAVVFFNEGYPSAKIHGFNPRFTGMFKLRLAGYVHQSMGHPVVMRVYADNYREKRLLGYFDMTEQPRVTEMTVMLKDSEHINIQPSDSGIDEKGKNVYNVNVKEFKGPGLALQWLEAEGPLLESWPPPSVKKLFGDTPINPTDPKKKTFRNNRQIGFELAPVDPKASARQLLESFATRAFRRPLEAGEADRFVKLSTDAMDAGDTFLDAMRVGFRAVLTAPQFLLFEEKPGKLDDFALASRLSYFLWSTMPDETLMKLAAEKKLSQPEVLRAQTERLLKDEKAKAFVQNFAGQWLDLRSIEATSPDKRLYPEFDELMQLGMVAETEAFFAEILKDNLSVATFIDSKFVMLNRCMADLYEIEGVKGEEFRKVALPAGSPRGGVLTQASVLKVTANGTNTSPVMRGAWVLKRILGQPPAPPPPGVGSVEPDTRGATTIREQLALHRNVESCAGCHAKIDPPGFALESFDVIGGWRERYRSQEKGDAAPSKRPGRYPPYKLGPAVDATGELTDGSKFNGIAEFKQLLLKQQEQVVRTLAGKLLTYASGAGISFADRATVE